MGNYVTEKDVRNFFTPSLTYDDISKYEIDEKIEAVEDFVEATYFNSDSTTAELAKYPCLLLIASKIILDPKLARKYHPLRSEMLGDYSYELASPSQIGSNFQATPHAISVTWEQMALKMLNKRTSLIKWKFYKANE